MNHQHDMEHHEAWIIKHSVSVSYFFREAKYILFYKDDEIERQQPHKQRTTHNKKKEKKEAHPICSRAEDFPADHLPPQYLYVLRIYCRSSCCCMDLQSLRYLQLASASIQPTDQPTDHPTNDTSNHQAASSFVRHCSVIELDLG